MRTSLERRGLEFGDYRFHPIQCSLQNILTVSDRAVESDFIHNIAWFFVNSGPRRSAKVRVMSRYCGLVDHRKALGKLSEQLENRTEHVARGRCELRSERPV